MDKNRILQRIKRLFIRQSVSEAAILITILAAVSKVIGFLREMMIAAFFGARKFTDSFVVANAVPGVLAGLVSGALSSVFIPLYAEWREKKGKEEAERFAGILLSNISVLLFLMTILSYFIAPYIIDILAPGFNEETKNLTLNFTYIMLPGIIFWGTYGIIAGIYNSQKSFVIPNIAGVLGNAVFILCIFLFHNKIGAYILPWGYLANVIFQYFLLLPGLRRIHFKLRGEVNFRYEGMKKALYLIGPILLGQSMGILNMAVDRIFGSFLPEGSISALNYASRIYHLPINLFVNAVATAIYTEFAFNAQSNNMDSLKSSMEKSLRAVLFFVIPSTFGFIFLANPIVRLAFQRGAFDALATQRTAECLIFYSIGLTFMSINPIMVRAFYALHDTKTPTINSMIALLSNIVLNFLFIRPLAHKGLALATSIASIISTILLYRSLKKKIPEPFSKDMMKNILRFVFGGILIGVLALISFNLLSVYLSKGQITFAISLLFSVGIAALFYLYLGNRWKIEEAKRIFNIIKKNLEVITHFLSLK
ncbi:MAG TPA: murein biosynthesis integral membrane protein MurJ [Dictyoglomaceae bacterium]|mgnify:CR=1 FL=1|nr:murein biosynthesis integral membrane protein MurJ [Dictyoglomaceae bacterium]